MIKAVIYEDYNNILTGFSLSGHADFDEPGKDIVCSSVSVLVINTINCIEKFTDADLTVTSDKKTGEISCFVHDKGLEQTRHDIDLLIKSMNNGLVDISNQYDGYLTIDKETKLC